MSIKITIDLVETGILKFEQSNYSQTTGSSQSVTASGLVTINLDYLTFTGYHGYGSARNTSAISEQIPMQVDLEFLQTRIK